MQKDRKSKKLVDVFLFFHTSSRLALSEPLMSLYMGMYIQVYVEALSPFYAPTLHVFHCTVV